MYSALSRITFLKKDAIKIMQCAHIHSIQSVAMRHPDYKRYPPWDYINQGYGYYASFTDKTSHRFDDNTKLIIIEGPFGVGKKDLAKKLAKAFDLHYEEDPLVDVAAYEPSCDYDRRELDNVLPDTHKFLDLQKFYRNPFDERVTIMQNEWLYVRYLNYIRALRHIFNTGQGAIMNRSCMSQHIIVDAMVKLGFLSKRYQEFVDEQRLHLFGYLKRPHIMIYLDAPYEVCMQRIRDRKIPYEAESKFFSKELFDAMEHKFKSHYLDAVSEHAELLIFDWTNVQHHDDVVMEIEKLPFYVSSVAECKQADWKMSYEHQYIHCREMYTETPNHIIQQYGRLQPYNVPELWHSGEAMEAWRNVVNEHSKYVYAPGYNKEIGDEYLFKVQSEYAHELEVGRKRPLY